MTSIKAVAALIVFCLCTATTATAAEADGRFRVTLLGTGTPRPIMDRFGPSILVEAGAEALLFDVGRGSLQRLEQVGVPYARLTAIFFTHLHSDHVVELPDLWLTGWLFSRSILAHHTTAREAAAIFDATAPKLAVYSHIVLRGGITPDEVIRETQQTYGGRLVMGADLMKIDVVSGTVD